MAIELEDYIEGLPTASPHPTNDHVLLRTVAGGLRRVAPQAIADLAGGDGVQDYAMQFTAESADSLFLSQNVFFGKFFEPSTMLGDCWWEFQFIADATNTQGVISDISHGGYHPMLLESLGNETEQYIYGNLYDGTLPLTEAAGKDRYKPGDLHHAVYAVFGQYLYLYLDGVLTARTQFDGTRQTGILGADGYLYLGASGDHQAFYGKILRARAFESEAAGGFGVPFASAPGAFRPERVFGDVWEGTSSVWNVDLTRPSKKVEDTSAGLNGLKHSGYRSLALGEQNWPESELPQYTVTPFALPTYSGTPLDIPAGADIFDDFSDDNITRFTDHIESYSATYPSIGNGRTARVGGSWAGSSFGFPPIGILEAHAVPLAADINAIQQARIATPNAATDYRIEVDTGRTGGCSVIVRYEDSDNYLMAIMETTGVTFQKRVAGTQTFHGPTAVANANWTTAVVETVGDTTTVTIGASVATHTEAALASGTTVGFGLQPLQRLKSIAVYELN